MNDKFINRLVCGFVVFLIGGLSLKFFDWVISGSTSIKSVPANICLFFVILYMIGFIFELFNKKETRND